MARRVLLLAVLFVLVGAGWFPAPLLRAADTETEPDTSPATHPEVVVSASRSPGSSLNLQEFPGHATIIPAEEIQRSGAGSLPQLLSGYAGLTALDTHGFGLGSDGGVNLRGIVNSSRTGALVLVNGIRQNRPTGDEVHWQSIPLQQIERIEIIRGGAGLGYGQGALSGVINIVLKQEAKHPFESEHTVEAGSFGHWLVTSAARGKVDPITYGASLYRREISGYRESTNSRTTTSTFDLGAAPWPNVRMRTHVLHSEDTSYFPGGMTPEASQTRRRQRGSFNGFFDEESTQVSGELKVTEVGDFSFAADAFARARETDSVFSDSRFLINTPSKGFTLRASHDVEHPDLRHGFVAAVDLLDEKSAVGSRGFKLDESNKASYGLWFEETIRLHDRVTMIGGARYDTSRFEEDISFPAFLGTLRFQGWSPLIGVSLDVAEPVTVFARYSRPFKAPDVDDFSAVVTTPFIGNLSLQPQQADDYEVGLRAHDARLGQADAAWFYNRIDDEILFNASAFQNQNMDTERIGMELSLEPASPWEPLHTRLTYTFIEAEFRKGDFRDKTIPGVPQHQFTAHASLEVIPQVWLTMDWQLVQDFFRINDFNNTLPADNYGVLNLGARWAHEPFEVYAKVLNATNEEYTGFQSSNGTIITTGENPAPPTAFLGGVTVRF